jgi:hypothetical protein
MSTPRFQFGNVVWLLLIVGALLADLPSALADEKPQWGDLVVRFAVKGEPPAMKPLDLGSRGAACKALPLDESCIVSDKHALRSVGALLIESDGEKLPIHPDYETKEEQGKVVNVVIENCRYEPHVIPVRTGQTLVVKNLEPDPYVFKASADAFLVKPGEDLRTVITRVDRIPTGVSCPIHRWMQAWIIAKDHPYVAVSDKDGLFKLKNLPVGKRRFMFWHEAVGYLKPLDPKFDIAKGQAELTIKPGENDFGTLTIAPPKTP